MDLDYDWAEHDAKKVVKEEQTSKAKGQKTQAVKTKKKPASSSKPAGPPVKKPFLKKSAAKAVKTTSEKTAPKPVRTVKAKKENAQKRLGEHCKLCWFCIFPKFDIALKIKLIYLCSKWFA